MRYMKYILLLATAALMTMATAVAQDDPPREPREMNSEQRDADREARREQWQDMSEEERAAAREQHRAKAQERRAARREHFENMSEEERQAMRERRAKHKAEHPGYRGDGKRGKRPSDDSGDDGV
jgi:hypothetical protein